MSTAPAIESDSAANRWPHRIRIALVVSAVAFVLHWISAHSSLGLGLNRPLVLLGAGGFFAAFSGVVAILVGVLVAARVLGDGTPRDVMLVIGWSLAVWSAFGGTMDDWLVLSNPKPGAPTGGPYWRLMPDFGLLALLIAGGHFVSASALGSSDAITRLPNATKAGAVREGLIALFVMVVVTLAVMHIAAGPRAAETRRGQVYFAIFVAHMIGVIAATKASPSASLVWLMPAPLLAGVVAGLFAAFKPGLPIPYDQLNNIPAWGPARALPAEMVGVGFIAIAHMCPASARRPASSLASS